jgi:hypothetical protein
MSSSSSSFAAMSSSSSSMSSLPNQAFPATLFWGDKLQALGGVYLVAEALVRSLLMSSDEFVDRVAWVVLERMVAGCGTPTERMVSGQDRRRALADIRRQLSEIRSTHASFHTVADASIVHGAVLVLLRVTHMAALSAEFAAAPYGYTLDRHVQDMVFLCDFAAMVLGKIQLGGGDGGGAGRSGRQHEPMVEHREGMPALWMPAHYANEAMVRGLAPLDVLRAGHEGGDGPEGLREGVQNATVARNASRLLQENSQAISNTWLSRNLLRLALGYKTVANACDQEGLTMQRRQQEQQQQQQEDGATIEELLLPESGGIAAKVASGGGAAASKPFPLAASAGIPSACRASVQEILRERAVAIQAWTQRHGIDTSAVFMDPLYRVEVELGSP